MPCVNILSVNDSIVIPLVLNSKMKRINTLTIIGITVRIGIGTCGVVGLAVPSSATTDSIRIGVVGARNNRKMEFQSSIASGVVSAIDNLGLVARSGIGSVGGVPSEGIASRDGIVDHNFVSEDEIESIDTVASGGDCLNYSIVVDAVCSEGIATPSVIGTSSYVDIRDKFVDHCKIKNIVGEAAIAISVRMRIGTRLGILLVVPSDSVTNGRIHFLEGTFVDGKSKVIDRIAD